MNNGFKGVWISKEVMMDEKLTAQEKILYAQIVKLEESDGCYASNRHFAQTMAISERYVTKLIASLIEKKYIRKESFDGRTRKICSEQNRTSVPNRVERNDQNKNGCTEQSRTVVPIRTEQTGITTPIETSSGTDETSGLNNNIKNTRKNTRKKELSLVKDIQPEKKAPAKKTKQPSEATQHLMDKYADLLIDWNDITGQEQVFDEKMFRYFMGKVQKHSLETVVRAVANYALSDWHRQHNAWKFAQMFTNPTFIGEWANREEKKHSLPNEKALRNYLEWVQERENGK